LAIVRGVSKITGAACTTAARTMGLAMADRPFDVGYTTALVASDG
jgi:hypothetical protein